LKIAAAVLTRNQYEHGRRDLFERTIESLKANDVDLYVIDNHSTDGTQDLVAASFRWKPYLSKTENTTSGWGTWTCCRVLAASNADVMVVSDDDMEWSAGFTESLTDWWEHAPKELVLTGGHLEPEFHWNKIQARVTYGETSGLLRASTGAASWTFNKRGYERLSAVAVALPINRQGVWDVPMCDGLQSLQWTIGQLDLAEHVGRGRSSWGNGTESMYGWDVEPVRQQL
jgi:hypothetical protein